MAAKLIVLRHEITIDAPAERLFQLSTNIDVVRTTLGMRPVSGRVSGCVNNGDTVLWRGWKFALPQMHESLIEACEAPRFFRDRMIRGRFATFAHDHSFLTEPDGKTRLSDEVRFTMPLGWLGTLVGLWIVKPHIRGLMRRRFALLRQLAEQQQSGG